MIQCYSINDIEINGVHRPNAMKAKMRQTGRQSVGGKGGEFHLKYKTFATSIQTAGIRFIGLRIVGVLVYIVI
jgi:hypothetical protein